MGNAINTKQRKSNIELLRIISMLLIIFHHFAVHGGFHFTITNLSFNHFWYYFILMGGKIGVNIFVLISGYFLIKKNGSLFDFKKLLKLWGEMLFYSVIIYLIFVLFLNQPFDLISFLNKFIPILSNGWWFASTYVALYLLHPFLNLLLTKLDKKTYKTLCITLLIIWCIIPTITNHSFESNSLLWFITLYTISGYISLHGLNPKLKCSNYLIIFVISTIVSFLITSILIVIRANHNFPNLSITYLYPQNMFSSFIIALSLFMTFNLLNIKYNKIINLVSSTTFGIYLIHDNNYVRPYIWRTLFQNNTYQDSSILCLYSIGICLLVFIVCSIIDLIRMYTIGRLYNKAIDKFSDNLIKPFKTIVNFFSNLLFGKE